MPSAVNKLRSSAAFGVPSMRKGRISSGMSGWLGMKGSAPSEKPSGASAGGNAGRSFSNGKFRGTRSLGSSKELYSPDALLSEKPEAGGEKAAGAAGAAGGGGTAGGAGTAGAAGTGGAAARIGAGAAGGAALTGEGAVFATANCEAPFGCIGKSLNSPWTRTGWLLTRTGWSLTAPSNSAESLARRAVSSSRSRFSLSSFLIVASYLILSTGLDMVGEEPCMSENAGD
mmetsp:Transcript_20534/g.48812  ORF Transcript_20534/g.48812 Transcript_20534/m.48812 type:complete len:229 (+) Transcript_20534:459-1145(+)